MFSKPLNHLIILGALNGDINTDDPQILSFTVQYCVAIVTRCVGFVYSYTKYLAMPNN